MRIPNDNLYNLVSYLEKLETRSIKIFCGKKAYYFLTSEIKSITENNKLSILNKVEIIPASSDPVWKDLILKDDEFMIYGKEKDKESGPAYGYYIPYSYTSIGDEDLIKGQEKVDIELSKYLKDLDWKSGKSIDGKSIDENFEECFL